MGPRSPWAASSSALFRLRLWFNQSICSNARACSASRFARLFCCSLVLFCLFVCMCFLFVCVCVFVWFDLICFGCLFVCFVCWFVCLFPPSFRLSVCLFVCLFDCFVCLFCLFVCLFICLFGCLSVLSVVPSLGLFVYLFARV